MRSALVRPLILLAVTPLITGCADLGSVDPNAPDAPIEGVPLDPDLHKPLLPSPRRAAKADSVDGFAGPLVSGMDAATEVWAVTHQWDELDSAPGLAWGADSGLTWDEKFATWLGQLKKVPSEDWHDTFELVTPWGRHIPAPRLECAESAMFLRATFAAWHGLPFYLSAWSPTLGRLYFGHFGVVTSDGERASGFPAFKISYTDFTPQMASMSASEILAAWPQDASLHAKFLTTLKDDHNAFLGAEAYAGAYFDEIFLNKRVGYFLLRMLTNLGSMHLVDADRNTFNLTPEAMRPGDLLLERWQAQGIGHTVIVLRADHLDDGTIEPQTVFGSMPRIQPKWYNASLSMGYFTSDTAGGPGDNGDSQPYASLGGGLKRWRTAVLSGGRWRNIVLPAHAASWIDADDTAAITARPATFEDLLGQMSANQKRELYLSQIADARQNLELRPASCSNRIHREEAFSKLYDLNAEEFYIDREATDRAHRTLADYVFAELIYDQSKTCCWNSSTADMYGVIMAYNEAHVWDDASQTCNEPVVFKARDGGYSVFADYATQVGVNWVTWSDDEPCPQASVTDDVEEQHSWTPFCDVYDSVLGLDDGNTDDGNTDDGNTDDGNTDDGNTDDGNTDDGGGNPGGSGDPWSCGGGAPVSLPLPWLLALALVALWRAAALRRG